MYDTQGPLNRNRKMQQINKWVKMFTLPNGDRANQCKHITSLVTHVRLASHANSGMWLDPSYHQWKYNNL